MNRLAIVITTAVAAVATPSLGYTATASAEPDPRVGVSSAPTQAGDQRPCVSQREYRDVQVGLGSPRRPGWRQARVADHFDITGARIRYQNKPTDHDHRHVDAVWKYRKCSAWGPGGWYVAVWYDNHSLADGYMRAKRKVPSRPYALGAAYFS